MSLSIIGLILIVIGWLIQASYMFKGQKTIKPLFVIAYMIGVLLLIIDGFMSNLISLAIFNLISMIVAGLVLILLLKPSKKRKK
jgi:hypothetical protein